MQIKLQLFTCMVTFTGYYHFCWPVWMLMHGLPTYKRRLIIPMVACCINMLLELLASLVLHCTVKDGWKLI